MLETIDSWVVAIVGWFEIIPVQGWAILAGLFIGAMVTQWIKRNVPIKILFPKMSIQVARLCIRSLALVASFTPTYFIWPADQYRFWAALAVGFGTPFVYRVCTFFCYKKWPTLEARFSGTGTGK